jgi:preprotein translocase subunit SecE
MSRSKLEKEIFWQEKRHYWKFYFWLLLRDLVRVRWVTDIELEKKFVKVIIFIFCFMIFFIGIEELLSLIFKQLSN